MDALKIAAYVRGLLDGLKLDKSTPERELLAALTEAVATLADENVALREEVENLTEELELLDSGVNSILDILESEEDDDDESCGCGHCHKHDDNDDKLELPCPVCGDVINIDDAMFDEGRFVCPHCEANLELDMGHHHGDGDGDCGCGHHN